MFVLCKCHNGIHSEDIVEGPSFYDEAVAEYINDGNNIDGIFAIYEREPLLDDEGKTVYESETGNVVFKEDRLLRWHINGIDLYINAYYVTQHYGGSQEGGWWYDSGELLSTSIVRFNGPCTQSFHNVFDTEIKKINQELEDGYGPHRSSTSCAGGFDIRVHISPKPGAKYWSNHQVWC